MDNHGSSKHGIVDCDKCEYRAEDFDIMKKHKMKHTGRIVFTCNICEFESSKQSMLVEHKESKHRNSKEWNEEEAIKCNRCEKQFKHAFLLKNHTCIPAFKYPCQTCQFVAISVIELLEHMNGVHSKKSTPKAPEPFPCGSCGLVLATFNLLQDHMNIHHPLGKTDCQYCDFCCEDDDILRSHMVESHPDVVMLHNMARQVENLADGFTELEHFKSELSNTLKSLFDNQNKIQQELFLIRNNLATASSQPQTKCSDSAPEAKEIKKPDSPAPPNNEPSAPARSYAKVSKPQVNNEKEKVRNDDATRTKSVTNKDNITEKEKPKETYASKTAPKLKTGENPKTTKLNEEIHVPRNILFVGDSHANKLDVRVLENDTNTNVDQATAYTTDEDSDARYPNKSFMKVVPERLTKKNYDTLVIQGGCNEISNIRLNSESTAANVKGWEEKVQKSRTKMFTLAQSSLENNPSLKKVIIVKSLPRYDPQNSDPNQIKAKLNQFGNTLYNTLWMQNGCPSNIIIVDQHLECQGPLREKRFGNPAFRGYDGKPWDGIHMRGRLAVRHYTNSLIRILSELSPSLTNYHNTCEQTRYQDRQQYNYSQGGQKNNFQYQQSSQKRRTWHGQRQTGGQGYNGKRNDGYNVKVSNRFSNLGNF